MTYVRNTGKVPNFAVLINMFPTDDRSKYGIGSGEFELRDSCDT